MWLFDFQGETRLDGWHTVATVLSSIPKSTGSYRSFYLGQVAFDRFPDGGYLDTITIEDSALECCYVLSKLYEKEYVESWIRIGYVSAHDSDNEDIKRTLVYVEVDAKKPKDSADAQDFISKYLIGYDTVFAAHSRSELLKAAEKAGFHSQRCECGAHITFGKNCPAEWHRQWCRLYHEKG